MKKMNKIKKIAFASFLLLFLLVTIIPNISSQEESEQICTVYLTGIGCPNCAFTDPAILIDYTSEHPNLIVIEYELYELREHNQEIINQYFNSYLTDGIFGIPVLIIDPENVEIGRNYVLNSKEKINSLEFNLCPLPDGTSIPFNDLDLTELEGKIKIWVKNRVLISGDGGNNDILKDILLTENISLFLDGKEYKRIKPSPVSISDGEVKFSNAIEIEGWVFQWNESSSNAQKEKTLLSQLWFLIPIILSLGIFFIYKYKKFGKIYLTTKEKNYLLLFAAITIIILFFIIAKYVSPGMLEELGYSLPLPIFTFLIALVDGFNPCNMFVLTFLLGILISASNSRKKIYTVGYTFVTVVFLIYFLFMAAWLNIFKYIGFITPLRIAIAIIALVAGIINCKELFAFRKGVTLMIQEKHKGPLVKKMEKMKDKIKHGSILTLILASISLAAFASLVELPCTAGFPIIYTGILTGKFLANSFSYYLYLILYNFIYVIPLLVIITIFGLTFKGKEITKRQMQIIKFVGGFIMIILGLILLINPGLIGLGFG